MCKLNVSLPGLKMKNPVIPASGCFGFGREFAEFYDLGILGGVVTKSITLNERFGNNTPRVCETYGGMLNAIGLQNPGSENALLEIDFLSKFNTEIIGNIAGSSQQDYIECSKIISNHRNVKAIELNISCPNVKQGGITFGTDKKVAGDLVRKVKENINVPLYIKLSPNVTNIVEIAKAVEEAGADGISMINTLIGMRIDLKRRKPILNNITGGLSGPAIKPVALRMVYEVSKNVSIPIIGIGGIENGKDVIEFFLAGASAIQVGTANFINPMACKNIIEELEYEITKYGVKNISELTKGAH